MDANFVEKALESNEFAKQMIQKARELLGGNILHHVYMWQLTLNTKKGFDNNILWKDES